MGRARRIERAELKRRHAQSMAARPGTGFVLQQAQFSSTTTYTTPVPPPEVLREHALVDPSFPERFMGMAERQALHRQTSETKELDAAIKSHTRGQWISATVTLGSLVAALVTIIKGDAGIGAAIFATGVGPVVGVFLINTFRKTPAVPKVA